MANIFAKYVGGQGGGGGGSLAIGELVVGATANAVLFAGPTSLLADNSSFRFDSSAVKLLVPQGTYTDSPTWPLGQIPGIAFSGNTASEKTGLNYTDDGSTARDIGIDINGVEGFRIRQNYSDTSLAYCVAWTMYPDTANRGTSSIGVSTAPYHLGYFESLLMGTLSTGRALLMSPLATSNAGLGFDNNTGQEWYFKAYDGTSYSELSLLAATASGRRSFKWQPVANSTADANPAHDLLLYGANKTAGTGAGGNVSIVPGTSSGGSAGKTLITGQILINDVAPVQTPDVLTVTNSSLSSSATLVVKYVANLAAGSATTRMLKANGTTSVPTAVVSGDNLASFSMGGYDGSTWKTASAHFSSATENWDSTHHGTLVTFNSCPTGSNNATTRFTLSGDGNVTLTPKLLWATDGGADIGLTGGQRPDNVYVKTNVAAGAKVLATAGIGVGNSAAATTLGNVVKKMEVFDAAGVSLGFIPIYNAIT